MISDIVSFKSKLKYVFKYDASKPDQLELRVYAQPGARKNEVVGVHLGASSTGASTAELKIKLKAPPVDGKANDCLIEFLSEIFSLPQSRIALLRGETSRHKVVLLKGLSLEVALDLLIKSNSPSR
jgi:uncharacterized protein